MHNLLRMFHYFDAHQAVVRSEGVPVYDPRHTEVAAWCIAAPRLEPLSKVTFGAVPERPSPLRDEVVIGALTRREEGDAGTRPGARSIVAMVGIDDVLDVLLPELLDYTGKDADMPRGALLHGPPGTGKTHAMRGLCASLGIQLVCEPLSAADFARGYVGENAGMVRALANRAGLVPWRVCAAAIDEIDGIAPVGDKAEGSKNDLRGVLLSQIGGVQDVPNFIVIGGTNYLDRMDPAFRRRASTQVYMGRPDTAGRRAWINLQLGGQNGVLQRYAPDAEPREQLLSDAVAWTLGFSHDHMRRASNRLRLTLAQIAGAEERIARRVCRTLELPHPATQQMLRGPHSAVGLRSVLRAALAAFARAERVLVAGEVVPRMYPAEGALARAGEDLVRELGAHFRGTGTPLTGRIVLDCTGLRRNGDRPCIWARIERTGGVGEVRAALARARELQGKPVWGSDELSDAWTLLADSQLWERIGEEVGPLDVRVQGIFGAGIAVAGPLEQPVVGVPYHAFGVVADDDRVLVRRVGTGWQRPGENGGAAWVPFQPNAADRRALRRAEEKAGVFLRLARFSSFAALNTAQIAARVGQIHQQRLAGRGVPADRARQVDNLTPSEKDSLYEETWFNSRQWVPDPVFAEHEVADIRGHVVDRVCDLLEILLEHLQDRNLDSDPPPRSTLDLALPVDPASGAAARFAAQTLLRACIEAPAGHFALLDRMSAGSGEDAAVAAAVNDAFAERLKIRSSVTLVDLNGLVQLHERPGESRPVTSAAVGPLTATYEAPNVTYEIRRQATMDAVVESMNEALDASSRAPGRFRHIYCVSVQHPYLLHVLSRRIFWPASEADEEEERIRKSKADVGPPRNLAVSAAAEVVRADASLCPVRQVLCGPRQQGWGLLDHGPSNGLRAGEPGLQDRAGAPPPPRPSKRQARRGRVSRRPFWQKRSLKRHRFVGVGQCRAAARGAGGLPPALCAPCRTRRKHQRKNKPAPRGHIVADVPPLPHTGCGLAGGLARWVQPGGAGSERRRARGTRHDRGAPSRAPVHDRWTGSGSLMTRWTGRHVPHGERGTFSTWKRCYQMFSCSCGMYFGGVDV
ncbi:hypothetical protein DFJ74DRAFT_655052 [Hyaloraphidium curvatum]|nr:hypothetical protein DFJ74DRAFT_655052 [Hyaloraphidium curvatum]